MVQRTIDIKDDTVDSIGFSSGSASILLACAEDQEVNADDSRRDAAAQSALHLDAKIYAPVRTKCETPTDEALRMNRILAIGQKQQRLRLHLRGNPSPSACTNTLSCINVA